MKTRFNTLEEWLQWQESLHWATIDLGLDRIREVAGKMDLLTLPFSIITVAGTNGKGSSIALLDSILSAEGYKTGAYTSPYINRYNERIHINREEVEDSLICDAFAAIDQARGETSLTYFEFGTLAALWIYKQQKVDIALLEVGMGGRLDAVNAWDADVALISTIDIDHIQWLGDNREDIGCEKAGIMRANTPVISGDPEPPLSIGEEANTKNAILYQSGTDYTWHNNRNNWDWKGWDTTLNDLPFPSLAGKFQINNAANVLAVLMSYSSVLPVSLSAIKKGLQETRLSGRLEQVGFQPDIILDATHNPHAAQQLKIWLQENPVKGKTYAIFSMLEDKDIPTVVSIMQSVIEQWFIVPLEGERGITVPQLKQKMLRNSEGALHLVEYNDVKDAWEQGGKCINKQDRLVVFGSFLLLSQFNVIYSE